MKLLAFSWLQGLHQKPDDEMLFLEENSGSTYIFGCVQREEVSLSTQVSSFC
jgi:hypothetical protein